MTEPGPFPHQPPIRDSQNFTSEHFIGSPARANKLAPSFRFSPDASLMHADGGNSHAVDKPGPLGRSPRVSSASAASGAPYMMLWGADGGLTTGYVDTTAVGDTATGGPRFGIAAVDPGTLQTVATWFPLGENKTLGYAYMQLMQETNEILVNAAEGDIYLVQRCGGGRRAPSFTTTRTISVADVMQHGEQLTNSMFDAAGNIWFTTGAISSRGDGMQNGTTYGFVTPQGEIVKQRIENEMVENGIAVSGVNVYMQTGPSGAADVAGARGYAYSLTAGSSSAGKAAISTRWRVAYDAGSGRGDVGTSRGSGTTPTLLGDDFVAFVDKADAQVHLNVYHQEPQGEGGSEKQLFCQVPLFEAGRSNADISMIGHFDGETYGTMVLNDYGRRKIYEANPNDPDDDINGDWADMSVMAGGMQRVDVDPRSGECSTRWTSPLAVKSVPLLSTATGLVYGWTQDTERAAGAGEYSWYMAATEWDTGRTAFRVHAGDGGVFSENWTQGTLGPDGTYYQTVVGGLVAVRDGEDH